MHRNEHGTESEGGVCPCPSPTAVQDAVAPNQGLCSLETCCAKIFVICDMHFNVANAQSGFVLEFAGAGMNC